MRAERHARFRTFLTSSTSRWSYVAALCVLGLTLGHGSQAHAWCQMTTSQQVTATRCECVTAGEPLAWSERCTTYAITQSTADAIPSGQFNITIDELRQVLNQAHDEWETVECDGTSVDVHATQLEELAINDALIAPKNAKSVSIFAVRSNWSELQYDPSAYAYTTVWHNTRTGEIYESDMEINLGRGPYALCDSTGCTDGKVDLRNVVTHEMGHYYGMAHSCVPTATMYPVSPAGEITKRSLASDDTTGFCSVYPPNSLPDECEIQDIDKSPHGTLEPPSSSGCEVTAPMSESSRASIVAMGIVLGGVIVRRRRASRSS